MNSNRASANPGGTSTEPTDAVVRRAIEHVAPDVVADDIPADADFADWAELDSMDFLAVLTTIKERTGIAVPELDSPEIATIDAFAAYLDRRR
jgi:acyl carrier protein